MGQELHLRASERSYARRISFSDEAVVIAIYRQNTSSGPFIVLSISKYTIDDLRHRAAHASEVVTDDC